MNTKIAVILSLIGMVFGSPFPQEQVGGAEQLHRMRPFFVLPTRDDITEMPTKMPVEAPTEVPDLTLPENATSQQGDQTVVLVSQKIVSEMLERIVAAAMLQQCDDRLQPALDFYSCVENTTDLPALWQLMGLNATLLRIRTVELTTIRQNNVSQETDTDVTLYDSDPNDGVVGLQDLITMIASQASKFCGNVESLMNCLDPYLSTCFPEPSYGNDVNSGSPQSQSDSSVMAGPSMSVNSDDQTSVESAENSNSSIPEISEVTPASNSSDTDVSDETTDDTGSGEQSDEEDEEGKMDEFFGIPMMTTQSRITSFIRQTFQLLCSDAEATVFKLAINSTQCVLSTASQRGCSDLDDSVINTREQIAFKNMTEPTPELCGGMKDAAECHVDLVLQNCGQDVSDLVRSLYQNFFQAVECGATSGDNEVATLRPAFNPMILGTA